MGARKGQDNFRESRARKVESNERLVSTIVGSIRRGTIFAHLNDLIVYVSERTKLHRTTIKKNPVYLRIVLDHFSSQPGAVEHVNDDDASSATLRAKYLAEQIKVKNLGTQLDRLTKSRELSERGKASIEHPYNHNTVDNKCLDDQAVHDLAFTNTAMVLLSLLERLSEKELGIIVEPESMRILDTTEVGERKVIAGPKRTKQFFDLISTHPFLRMSPIRNAKK